MPRHGLLVDVRCAFRKVVDAEAHEIPAEQVLHDIQHRGMRAELVHPFATPEPVLHLGAAVSSVQGQPGVDQTNCGCLQWARHLVGVDPARRGFGEYPVEVLAVGRGLGRREDVDRERVALLVVLSDPVCMRGGGATCQRQSVRQAAMEWCGWRLSRVSSRRDGAHCSSVSRLRCTPSTGWYSRSAPPGLSPDMVFARLRLCVVALTLCFSLSSRDQCDFWSSKIHLFVVLYIPRYPYR